MQFICLTLRLTSTGCAFYKCQCSLRSVTVTVCAPAKQLVAGHSRHWLRRSWRREQGGEKGTFFKKFKLIRFDLKYSKRADDRWFFFLLSCIGLAKIWFEIFKKGKRQWVIFLHRFGKGSLYARCGPIQSPHFTPAACQNPRWQYLRSPGTKGHSVTFPPELGVLWICCQTCGPSVKVYPQWSGNSNPWNSIIPLYPLRYWNVSAWNNLQSGSHQDSFWCVYKLTESIGPV